MTDSPLSAEDAERVLHDPGYNGSLTDMDFAETIVSLTNALEESQAQVAVLVEALKELDQIYGLPYVREMFANLSDAARRHAERDRRLESAVETARGFAELDAGNYVTLDELHAALTNDGEEE